MNQRTEELLANFSPKVAVVVYEDWGQNKFYLESHSFDSEGRIMEGKPLLQDTIQSMLDVFFDERQDSSRITGYIPYNVLSYDNLPGGKYNLVWYRPAETRVIHFSDQLKIPSGEVWLPPLLYKVMGSKLYIFALKSDTRPTVETRLFKAPFHNIYSDGSVCLGNAKVKKPDQKSFENVIQYWEDMFWLSEFSHLLSDENPTKSNINTLWKAIVESQLNLKWSALKNELIEIKKLTLKTILR